MPQESSLRHFNLVYWKATFSDLSNVPNASSFPVAKANNVNPTKLNFGMPKSLKVSCTPLAGLATNSFLLLGEELIEKFPTLTFEKPQMLKVHNALLVS